MTRNRQRLGVRIAVVLAAVGFAACGGHPKRPAETKPGPKAGELGSRLPDFVVTDLTGHEFSSASLHGKVALVDFWATWCQPCKKEMPGYQKLVDRYGSQGFAVVGFKATMMMDTEDPLRFAKEAGVHYPLAIASASITERFGGLLGLPTTFVYDRAGILRQKIIGFEYTETIESEIKSLLRAN
jgi:thiol-disulfide isomerase/thioredoxin